MGKECMARSSRQLWGGMSLKTTVKEASPLRTPITQMISSQGMLLLGSNHFLTYNIVVAF